MHTMRQDMIQTGKGNVMPNRNYRIATLSLLLMAAGFLAVLALERLLWPASPWLAALTAGFEAGLIGGLADWFAVTALFRHPLRLPIPHTAILPENRERITEGLASMVENDLLNKDSIIGKLQAFDAAKRLLTGARRALRTDAVKSVISQILASIVSPLSTGRLKGALRDMLAGAINRADLGNLVRLLAEEADRRDLDAEALDALLKKTEEAIAEERFRQDIGAMAVRAVKEMELTGLIKVTLPALVGMMGEAKVGKLIQDFLLTAARDLRNLDNPTRGSLRTAIRQGIGRLPENPAVLERMETFRQELLAGDALDRILASTLEEADRELKALAADPGAIEEKVIPFLDSLLRDALHDRAIVDRLEAFIDEQLGILIDRHHKDIGKLVRDNLNQFDTQTLIRLIEDKVGNDLQWIRVNGAICGFVVGLCLFGLKTLVLWVIG